MLYCLPVLLVCRIVCMLDRGKGQCSPQLGLAILCKQESNSNRGKELTFETFTGGTYKVLLDVRVDFATGLRVGFRW